MGDEDLVKRDPWELAAEAVVQMARNGDVMRSDRLKQVMQQIDPNFDERNAGFNRFSKFVLEAGQRGVVTVTKLDNGQFEIGPGSGMWNSLFTPQSLPSITKVYGIEPNTTIHPLLRHQKHHAEFGFQDRAYVARGKVEQQERARELRLEGRSLVDIARELGIPANQASFHLRQLAKYGVVEEDPEAARDKRDRVWRLVAEEGLTVNLAELEAQPGGRAAATVWRRSASATFLFRERGFDAHWVRDGITADRFTSQAKVTHSE